MRKNLVHSNFWKNFESTHLDLTDKGGGFTIDKLSVKKTSSSTYYLSDGKNEPFILTSPKDFLKTIQQVESMTQYKLFGKDYLVKEFLDIICTLLYIQTLSNIVDEAKKDRKTLDDTENANA